VVILATNVASIILAMLGRTGGLKGIGLEGGRDLGTIHSADSRLPTLGKLLHVI
jgi:hypothetical protein